MRRRGAGLAFALLLGACGGDAAEEIDTATPEVMAADSITPTAPDTATEAAGSSVVNATLNEWAITLSRDTVPAGPVSFQIRNAGAVVHRFEIEGNGEEVVTDDLAPASEIMMSLTLQPGTYEVYCPITGGGQSHAERGMRTTLHVR